MLPGTADPSPATRGPEPERADGGSSERVMSLGLGPTSSAIQLARRLGVLCPLLGGSEPKGDAV